MKRILTALFALAFATAAVAADGAAVYKAKCALCHGAGGEGTKMAGPVKGKTAAQAKEAVTAGVKAAAGKKEMKPVKGVEGADLDAVSAFVGGLK